MLPRQPLRFRLMGGAVAGGASYGNWPAVDVAAMRALNASLANHPDLVGGVVLAVGGGVGIAVRR
jgi:hypothetical protein